MTKEHHKSDSALLKTSDSNYHHNLPEEEIDMLGRSHDLHMVQGRTSPFHFPFLKEAFLNL